MATVTKRTIYRSRGNGRFVSRQLWATDHGKDGGFYRQTIFLEREEEEPPKVPTGPSPVAYRDWMVIWQFTPEARRRAESPARQLSWVTKARTETEAIRNVQLWVISPEAFNSEFNYDWALEMDSQELWAKSAIILTTPEEPALKRGEVRERQ